MARLLLIRLDFNAAKGETVGAPFVWNRAGLLRRCAVEKRGAPLPGGPAEGAALGRSPGERSAVAVGQW